VALRATLGSDGRWAFCVAGVRVPPFDARAVISPCALDATNHAPLALHASSERARLLRIALYAQRDTEGKHTCGSEPWP